MFNCSFYDESAVSTTSVRINFRENVIATFTNYDLKRKLHVIQKKTKTKKKNRFSPLAKQLMIASACCLTKLLSTYLLLKLDSAKRDGRSIDELICSYLD